MMPTGTLAYKDDTRSGFKKIKDRITILVTASMEGEKKAPLTIGKSARPRCFKDCKRLSMHMDYQANRKAWMTSDIFRQWLQNFNRRMAMLRRKVVLVIDNAPSHHPNVKLSAVKLAFLPPNITAKTQSIDQGVIRSFKANYTDMNSSRRSLLTPNKLPQTANGPSLMRFIP